MSKTMRFLLVLVFLGIGVYFLYPTVKWYFFTTPEEQVQANGSREQIRNLALREAKEDLDALVELTKVPENLEKEVPADFAYLKELAAENYKLSDADKPSEWTLNAVLLGFNSNQDVYRAIENYYREKIMSLKELKNKTLQLGLDLSGGMSVVINTDVESLAERLEREPTDDDLAEAVALSMEILNNRIDKFGVTEPQIRKQANNQILIEIPGEVDPERVNSFLMGKGSLQFHIVDEDATAAVTQYVAGGGLISDEGYPEDEGVIGPGFVVRGYFKKDSYDIDQFVSYVALVEEVGLDGSHIEEASVIRDQIDNKPLIIFRLDTEGGELFYKLTSENTQKRLAVVMDDKVKASATITEAIREAVSIQGFEFEEANDLALVLRTAAMPVELNVESQQAVGASMGADTINAGLQAILYGFIAVIIFMLAYYKMAGLIADFALILNLFLITAILSSFNMTLTMTSIAGLILNVGMAVDANVIIFERIKEELRMGKNRASAVESGFKKAFWTVMDANITTFIAAIFLSQLAKGPVQGFAITLAVGIVCSLFTAIFVSRLLFDIGTDGLKKEKVSIGWGMNK